MTTHTSTIAFATVTIVMIAVAIGLFMFGSAGILVTGQDVYGILIVLGGMLSSCVLGAMFEANRRGLFDINYPDEDLL